MAFKYDLDARVKVSCSGEEGDVIGRAEYTSQEPQYWIRSKAADGRAVESWWSESALDVAQA